jgi:molybdopterin-guanine dinucleotide biosynthesis protein A
MYKDITGIVLAGGKSSRMGTNKSFLKFGDKEAVEITINLMKSLFSEVIISSNQPEEYEKFGLPIFKDIYEFKGPLAGIHSGLLHSQTEKNFVISCDVPLITKEMIEYLVESEGESDIVICKADGFNQQLVGFYKKSLLPDIEKILSENQEETRAEQQHHRKCNVMRLVESSKSKIIDANSLPFYKEDMFFNMNRPADYEKILKSLEKN